MKLKNKKIKAWHFLNNSGLLRDGNEPPPDGEWLIHKGPVQICSSGLHASKRPLDALAYAPGAIVCRVECEDIAETHGDKFVCRRRKILWRYDATEVLRKFARLCALDVVHLWDAPDVVIRYLRTGDDSIRAAAAAAAADAVSAVSAAGAAVRAARATYTAAYAAVRAANAYAAAYAAYAAARDASYAAAYDANAAAREKQNKRLYRMLTKGKKE